jgi:hypothetical protein
VKAAMNFIAPKKKMRKFTRKMGGGLRAYYCVRGTVGVLKFLRTSTGSWTQWVAGAVAKVITV